MRRKFVLFYLALPAAMMDSKQKPPVPAQVVPATQPQAKSAPGNRGSHQAEQIQQR